MTKIAEILLKLAKMLEYIALKIDEYLTHDEYYVYVPKCSKPRYKHKSFVSAKKEAERIADLTDALEEIQVLKIVYETNGNLPPF